MDQETEQEERSRRVARQRRSGRSRLGSGAVAWLTAFSCISLWYCPAASGQEPRPPAETGGGGQEDSSGAPSSAPAPSAPSGDEWVYEPVILEGGTCRFLFDRRDGSYLLADRRTGVRWFSRREGRGFASALVLPAAGGPARWTPLDRVEDLSVSEKSIRFRIQSSQATIPLVRGRVDMVGSGDGVELTCETRGDGAERVVAVGLVDRGLPIAPDEGDAVIPRAAGEWCAASGDDRRYWMAGISGFPQPQKLVFPPAAGSARPDPLTLRGAALHRRDCILLVEWDDPGTELLLDRDSRGLTLSAASASGTGSIRLRTAGADDLGFAAATKTYRQGRAGEPVAESLRYKTGFEPELRAFHGAAIFRPDVKSVSFAEIAEFAQRLRGTLEIDQAAFVVSGWNEDRLLGENEDARPGALLPARSAAGGDQGLADCSRTVRELGFIFGLELEGRRLDAPGLYGPEFVGPVRPGLRNAAGMAVTAWENRAAVASAPWSLAAVAELCSPQLVVVSDPPGDSRIPSPDGWTRFAAELRDLFGMAGIVGRSELQIENCCYLEGAIDPESWTSGNRATWPFFHGAYGHCARFAVSPEKALSGGLVESFLVHLLLGEVPTYVVPPRLGDGGRPGVALKEKPWRYLSGAYAQEDGWAAGRGLSREEIFLKNTWQVASHVARWRVRTPLLFHRPLNAERTVRESFFGTDMRITVNFGPGQYHDEEDDFILPPGGFVVRYPFLLAFCALRINDVEYERPAFFVVRSLEGKMYLRAERVHIYHGFGPPEIRLGGKDFTVEKETVTKIW